MAVTRKKEPDITVLEFGRLEDHIIAELDRGQREFRAAQLADATDLSIAKVYEALLHLEKKHEHVSELAAGRWEIELPE